VSIEQASTGASLLQELKRSSDFSYSAIGLKPIRDKQTRMAIEVAAIDAGRVYLPGSTSWLAAYEAELGAFPRSAHDDRVDSTSQFLAYMRLAYRSGFPGSKRRVRTAQVYRQITAGY